VKANFVVEIEHLLQKVPAAVWADDSLRGLLYDFLPWHGTSSIAIQTAEDDPHDPASWKYYDCADSDASRIREEVALYRTASEKRLVYHRLLIEAAEALLSIDFGRYGQPTTVYGFCLYKPFQLQVTDPDQTFRFNYCEYVLARRLDIPEPGAAAAPPRD
jgi:hypothetical protein